MTFLEYYANRKAGTVKCIVYDAFTAYGTLKREEVVTIVASRRGESREEVLGPVRRSLDALRAEGKIAQASRRGFWSLKTTDL